MAKAEESIRSSINKLEKAAEVANYEIKVPKEVRIANAEKLAQFKGELAKLAEAKIALNHIVKGTEAAT